MTYYHVFLLKDAKNWYAQFSLDKEDVKRIVERYNSGKTFSFVGIAVRYSNIAQFAIFASKASARDLRLPDGRKIMQASNDEIIKNINNGLLEGLYSAMTEFDVNPPEEIPSIAPKESVGTKEGVFIAHGRDIKQALLLQKHLKDKLGINAKIFDDFKEETGSVTIIELLEYIWKKAGYAFIIAAPEDLGVLREEFEKTTNKMFRGTEKIEVSKVCVLLETLKTRARQNVVFEFGLLMGVLGRDKVCCLLQEGVKEKPSDIAGVLYTEYSKSVEEKFTEIDSKVKKALGKT